MLAGNLKEIAEQTGVSYPTIRSRLLKIIDILRAEIGQDFGHAGVRSLDAFEDEPSAAELIKKHLIAGRRSPLAAAYLSAWPWSVRPRRRGPTGAALSARPCRYGLAG